MRLSFVLNVHLRKRNGILLLAFVSVREMSHSIAHLVRSGPNDDDCGVSFVSKLVEAQRDVGSICRLDGLRDMVVERFLGPWLVKRFRGIFWSVVSGGGDLDRRGSCGTSCWNTVREYMDVSGKRVRQRRTVYLHHACFVGRSL